MMMPRQATIRPLARKVRSFIRDESGVMAPQILFFFFMMLLVGGVAVDLMRFEAKRVQVQQTMDRATLAAASLENMLDPEDVVNSYFDTAGLSSELDSITVTEAANSRKVQARATVRSDNYFMSMMDIPYLEAGNRSEAEQTITNVEIALVLDVSGSMFNTPSRITNLKSAAKEFIDTVLDSDSMNKISIALVPYNGQVNLGPTLLSKFTVANAHGYANSHCLDLPTSTYSSTSLSRSTPFPQTPFGDSWSGTSTNNSYTAIQGPSFNSDRNLFSNVWCQPVAGNFVRMHSNNKTALKAQIDGLVAIGATSIDLGMKWGSFLLDPSSRSITSEMAASGQVPAYFASRPANFGDKETMKVVVLMTDGENFTQERFGNYRTGLSPIYRSNGDGMLSIQHTTGRPACAGTRQFWVPHRWTNTGTQPCGPNGWQATAWNSGSGVTQLTWQQVWQLARTDWVAWQLYARALGAHNTTLRTNTFDTWNANFAGYTDTGTMDDRLDQVCEAAKAQGIIVYGIAFEAPDGGKAAIEDCASSPSSTYYFDADGLEIQTAFRLIASNLSQLRLTQ
jgi:Flp pilus assembly protein TadG